MSTTRIQRRPVLLVVLAVLLFLECAMLAAAAVFLTVELLVAHADSVASGVAILVLTIAAAIWLGVMATHTLLGRSWIRGAAVVWQILQIAVAVGSFQGLFARPDLGWLLLAPSIAVLILLFTRPVMAATKRVEQGPED